MSKLETITHNEEVLALVIRKNIKVVKSGFFSPEEYPFQLGVHIRKTGEKFDAHIHKPVKRIINTTQEFLYIQKGKVRIIFYDNNQIPVGKTILNEGDAILLVSSGHEIRMLRDSRILEVKQGPYMGEDIDKVKFV